MRTNALAIINDCKSDNVPEESIVMSCAAALRKGPGYDWRDVYAAIRKRFNTDEDPTGDKARQRIIDLAWDYMIGKKPIPPVAHG